MVAQGEEDADAANDYGCNERRYIIMRKAVFAAGIVLLAGSVFAWPWGKKDEIKNLKPAVGYTEKAEVVTNSWNECIRLHKLGPQTEALGVSGGICVTTGSFFFSTTNSVIVWGDNRYNHKCLDCAKPHVSDWPKTATDTKGVQEKKTTTIYKDGKAISKIVEYEHPYRKITTTTVTKIEYKKEVTTEVEHTKEEDAK